MILKKKCNQHRSLPFKIKLSIQFFHIYSFFRLFIFMKLLANYLIFFIKLFGCWLKFWLKKNCIENIKLSCKQIKQMHRIPSNQIEKKSITGISKGNHANFYQCHLLIDQMKKRGTNYKNTMIFNIISDIVYGMDFNRLFPNRMQIWTIPKVVDRIESKLCFVNCRRLKTSQKATTQNIQRKSVHNVFEVKV